MDHRFVDKFARLLVLEVASVPSRAFDGRRLATFSQLIICGQKCEASTIRFEGALAFNNLANLSTLGASRSHSSYARDGEDDGRLPCVVDSPNRPGSLGAPGGLADKRLKLLASVGRGGHRFPRE